MVTWGQIQKCEAYSEGTLVWEYRSYATLDNRSAGSVSDPTRQGCQNQIDHWKKNPDEWISQAMKLGFL